MNTKEELRKFLIDHLDNSIVPYTNWQDRDTLSAQEGQAKMRMYLKSGCDFKLKKNYDEEVLENEIKEYLENDNIKIMYISIFHYDFENNGSWNISYSPHPKYLEKCIKNGNKDWYQ